MTELGHLISTALVDNECPRELLGKMCTSGEYECACDNLSAASIAVVNNKAGVASLVRLTMTLKPGSGDATKVMDGIELSGLKAHFDASYRHVEATFDLRMPQNAELKALAA